MGIRLFPEHFLVRDQCFGLFRVDCDGAIDLPVTIRGDAGTPFHVVHSDPDHLAYLAGMLVLQASVYGIDELELPPTARRPLLVVTDTPGRFRDAYLNLHISNEGLRRLCKQRRIALWQKLQQATNPRDKREYWDWALGDDEERTKLHNFFPAKQLLRLDGNLRPIASRDHLGRGDSVGSAVVIVKSSHETSVVKLEERFRPFLVLVDADGLAVPASKMESPAIIYHESIFAPELTRKESGQFVLCCLPDARFEQFCSQASLRLVEPAEPDEIGKYWNDIDGALFSLMEQPSQRGDRVVAEVCRSASRLRSVLLSLPVGITTYEQALIASGQPECFRYSWSVSEPLQALESRLPEVAAAGEWEEYVLGELIAAFQRLCEALTDYSPKREVLLAALHETFSRNRRAAMLLPNQVVADAVRWLAPLPRPFGLGLDAERSRVVTISDVPRLAADEDCIVPQAFDPHQVFSALARIEPREITLILLQNELRFVGERFLRTRSLLPDHPVQRKILRPICDQVERLKPASPVTRKDRVSGLFSDADFDVFTRMFTAARSADYETVLADDTDDGTQDLAAEVEAFLVRLENERAVFLAAQSRVTYVDASDSICRGNLGCLEPGHRLIVVRPEARDFIANRIIDSKREEESGSPAQRYVASWQEELKTGMDRLGLGQAEVLRRIQALGSKRCTTAVIGQWASGVVFGPLDPEDVRRIGEAVQSRWLCENWQRVGAALLMLRSGHRTLGHRITRIIQSAAIGDFNLSPQDEEFLNQLGITFGQLQDAVIVLKIEAVSSESRTIPSYQVGAVIPL